jgi:hypothetical protein
VGSSTAAGEPSGATEEAQGEPRRDGTSEMCLGRDEIGRGLSLPSGRTNLTA